MHRGIGKQSAKSKRQKVYALCVIVLDYWQLRKVSFSSLGRVSFLSLLPKSAARQKVSNLMKGAHRSNLSNVRGIDCFGVRFKLSRHLTSRNDVKIDEKRVKTEKHKTYLFPFSFSLFSPSHPAMTLAEVLITIGIIGVIAAMTIPNLIESYQKQATATKLKETYSMLNQALNNAAADNGVSLKDLTNFQDDKVPISSSSATITNEFAKNYILPYLAAAKDFGYCLLSTTGRSVPNCLYGICTANVTYAYRMYLKNGTYLEFYPDNDGTYYCNMMIKVDINGNQKPNKNGFDIFVMYLYNSNAKLNKRLLLYGEWADTTTLLDNSAHGCNKNATGYYCGALIMKSGWTIPDEYPWN